MRENIKRIIPRSVFNFIRPMFQRYYVLYSYTYDYFRYLKYSSSLGYTTPEKLESIIVMYYHVLEKGLTMPNVRLGFGKDRIPVLCDYCDLYIQKYDISKSIQVQHAIGVLKEYLDFHVERDFEIHYGLKGRITRTLSLMEKIKIVDQTKQLSITRDEYFNSIDSSFLSFSNSRKSIRNYSEQEISIEVLKNALALAQNAPSACNRQTSRVYVFSDKQKIKELLSVQDGAGGFGNLADKLLIITATLGTFGGAHERYQAYIDGGIFAMNTLYSLHAHSIGACILNCSNSPDKDKKLHRVSGIGKDEVFISMISCGYLPEKFSIASSKRYDLDEICTFI